jgi:aryl-phospho-beta-D-glucosidase BglC (GH1 family)
VKRPIEALAVSAALLSFSAVALAQVARPEPAAVPKRTHEWWRDRPIGGQPYRTDAKKLPLISVKGNRFVDPDGKAVLFRGLAISDPDKLEMQGHWNKDHFVKVKEMGTTLLRIPVHPVAWRERTPAEYVKLLDQAVGWATDLDMHIIIDWHSIGNLTTGVFQDPMYDTTKEETFAFWRAMSRRYNGHNTVAFFELFNEPAAFGRVNWEAWKQIVEDEIAIIRANNQQAIPLVAGFDWAYDLTPLRLNPIAAEGIGYTTHPYSNKRPQPWEPKWEEDFGFAASKYPIIATEFGGFAMPPAPGATPPTAAAPTGAGGRGGANAAAYGPAIIKYLESKGISWTVWCFDPEWGPTLISNWEYKLNSSGEFAKAAMHGELK